MVHGLLLLIIVKRQNNSQVRTAFEGKLNCSKHLGIHGHLRKFTHAHIHTFSASGRLAILYLGSWELTAYAIDSIPITICMANTKN